jgi:hypothetical protein
VIDLRRLHVIVVLALALCGAGWGQPARAVTAPLALAGPLHGAGDRLALQAGCGLDGALRDAGGRPVAGAVLVVEASSMTARTDAQGRYRLVFPGAGAWRVRVEHPAYGVTVWQLELAAGCVLTAERVVETEHAASAVPLAPHHFTGYLSIDGDPAPAGTTVLARIGGHECGRARVQPGGGYRLDVADGSRVAGCGAPGTPVDLAVLPPFGQGWTLLQSVRFQPGAATELHLPLDLRSLPPDPANVPLLPWFWDDLTAVPVGSASR